MSKSATINPDATSGEPTRLKLVAPVPNQAKDESKVKAKPSAAFARGMDDEEDGAKKRRELIPLSYSDDEDDATKAEKKKRKLKDMVSAIPNEKAGLWVYEVKWDKLNGVSYGFDHNGKDFANGIVARQLWKTSFDRSWQRNPLSTSVQRKKKS